MKIFKVMCLIIAMLVPALSSPLANEEEELHKEFLENVRLAVEEICLSMQQFMSRPDKLRSVHILDRPEINAYADTKGDVTFFMGMVDFVRNEHEIAAVCGHEIAHLSAQHIKRSLGTSILATVAQHTVGGMLGDLAGSALASKQSRKHEREADERGLVFMWNAGYDPRVIWKFWKSIDNHYKGGNNALEQYFSTHPVHNERIENFKVLLVRYCVREPGRMYCDEVMNDEHLVNLYNAFEAR